MRDGKGRVRGNIYAQHDEPLSARDAETFDPGWLDLVADACRHKSRAVNETAWQVLTSIQDDPMMRHRHSRVTMIAERLTRLSDAAQCARIQSSTKIELSEKDAKNQAERLSSNIELSPSGDEKTLSSKRELSGESRDCSRVRKSHHNNVRSFTQSVIKKTYVSPQADKKPLTGVPEGFVWPDGLQDILPENEQPMLAHQLNQLAQKSPSVAEQVAISVVNGWRQKRISNPVGYLLPAQTVLDIAQKLYETHKLTSYPRTDCGYLPVSMREEIPQVLSAVVGTDPALQPVVAQLDTQFVSRIWNDKKITAHHGIIPTKHTGDLSKLSDEERNVYQLVRLHYLAQFMPLMEVDATEATFNIGGQLFRTRGNVVVKAGWKSLFGKMADDDEKGDEAVLPAMQAGQVCQVQGAEQKAQQTKPPAPYNDGTLIAAMTNAAAFVTDAALKKVLKENAGIGTEATRAGIIDTLVKRGFLVREKKALRSTPLGRSLVDVLPGTLTNPGLTALWEQMLDEVAAGKVSLDDFMAKQSQWVSQLVAQGKSQPLAMQVPPSPLCPVCGGKTSQRKGKNGSFWGCLNYPDCKGIVGDGGNAKTLQGQGRSSLPTRLKIKLR